MEVGAVLWGAGRSICAWSMFALRWEMLKTKLSVPASVGRGGSLTDVRGKGSLQAQPFHSQEGRKEADAKPQPGASTARARVTGRSFQRLMSHART